MSLATLRAIGVADPTGPPTPTNCGYFGLFRPACWPQLYEQVQYGRITRPGDVQQPVPNAPQTPDQMTVPGEWTPDEGIAGSYQAYVDRLRARIAADEAAGDYNPEGNLPVTADGLAQFWEKYHAWILAGAAAVGGAVVLGALRR